MGVGSGPQTLLTTLTLPCLLAASRGILENSTWGCAQGGPQNQDQEPKPPLPWPQPHSTACREGSSSAVLGVQCVFWPAAATLGLGVKTKGCFQPTSAGRTEGQGLPWDAGAPAWPQAYFPVNHEAQGEPLPVAHGWPRRTPTPQPQRHKATLRLHNPQETDKTTETQGAASWGAL